MTEFSIGTPYTAPVPRPATFRKMLQAAGVTQQELARAMGCSEPRITQLFRQATCTPAVAAKVYHGIQVVRANRST